MKRLKMILLTVLIPILLLGGLPVASGEELRSGEYEPLLLAGYDFTIARLTDGTWWSWGDNTSGQLGLGNSVNRSMPTRMDKVPELDTAIVKKARVIDRTVIIMLDDGSVYRWGLNIPHVNTSTRPIKITTNRKIDDVGFTWNPSEKNVHSSIAFLSDEKVYVAGSGYNSGFGRGLRGYGASEQNSTVYQRTVDEAFDFPVMETTIIEKFSGSTFSRVVGGKVLSNIKLVEGDSYGFDYRAVSHDNEIYSWGSSNAYTPLKHNKNIITGNIERIFSGRQTTYALTDKKELWVWTGAHGEMKRLEFKNVKDVSVDNHNVSILLENGDFYLKGENGYGSTGGETLKDFKKVASDVIAIESGYRHTVWMTSDGKVWGMGWNAYQQLSSENDGSTSTFKKINTISGVDTIGSTSRSSYAAIGPKLYTWGEGDGDILRGNLPRVSKTFNSPIKSIKGATPDVYRMFTTVLENGQQWSIGNNYQERLGFGRGDNYKFMRVVHTPIGEAQKPNTVDGITYVRPEDKDLQGDIFISDAVQGGNGGSAIDEKGRLLAWGWSDLWGDENRDFQDRGDTRIAPKATEGYVRVPTEMRFIEVSGGGNTSIALGADGRVYSRGSDTRNALGRGGPIYQMGVVDNLSKIKKISMGGYTGLALDEDGDIHAWGQGNIGQIGDGSIGDTSVARNITHNIDVKFKDINSGHNSMFAIAENGDVYSWGMNKYGQLGLGDKTNRSAPRKVEGLPGKAKEVVSASEHAMILLENGDVYVSGADGMGQLGFGKVTNELGVIEVPFPDYITLNNKDNVNYKMGSTLTLSGNITSLVDGHKLQITYEVESSSGIVESGTILNGVSTRRGLPFSKNIKLDSKYGLGGYTLNVVVKNDSTKQSSGAAVNFALLDTTPPSNPQIHLGDWSAKEQLLVITPGADFESGVSRTEWRYVGEDWVEYTKDTILKKYGEIEARTIDNAGNMSKVITALVKIDTEPPKISFEYDKAMTHDNLPIVVHITDSLSGIKHLKFSGKTYTSPKTAVSIVDNGTYEFEVEDNVGNVTKEKLVISNIDKALRFSAPKSTIKGSLTLRTDKASIPLESLKIEDWRDSRTGVRLSLGATQLKNGSVSLPKNTLRVGNTSIDNGVYPINLNGKRGEYTLPMNPIDIYFDLGITKTDKYTSTLTWDLIQAP